MTRKILFALGILATGMVFVFYANVDWMSNERFYVPYIGLMYALALSSLMSWTKKAYAPVLARASAIFLLLVLFGSDQFARAHHMVKIKDRYPLHLMTSTWIVDLGKDLKRRYNGEGSLATKRVGAIPFYSGLETIDAYGLVDREIARVYHTRPKAERRRAAAEIVFERDPTLVLSFTKNRLIKPRKATIKNAKNFSGLDRFLFEGAMKQQFVFVKEYRTGASEWGYLFEEP